MRLLSLFLLVLSGLAGATEAGLPAAGSYGFDWLKPDSTRCQQLTPKLIARFKQCTPPDISYSFGLDFPGQACRINARSEFMVYVTRKQCQEAFETMQAHAP